MGHRTAVCPEARARRHRPKPPAQIKAPAQLKAPAAVQTPILHRTPTAIRHLIDRPPSVPLEGNAQFAQLALLDKREGSATHFTDIVRAQPVLLAPLHYFAHAQARMGGLQVRNQSMAPYQARNKDLLWRVARDRHVVGLQQWLVHMCSEKLGRDGVVDQDNVEDVNRMFLELREALNLCDTLHPGETVMVGCDNSTAHHALDQKRQRSFDLQVRDAKNNVVRQIEVTSFNKPVTEPDDLERAIEHVVHKVVDGKPSAKYEGAVAFTWDSRVDPNAFVQLCATLLSNQDRRTKPYNGTFAKAGRTLDRIMLFSNALGEERVYAVLNRQGDRWLPEIGPFMPPAIDMARGSQ